MLGRKQSLGAKGEPILADYAPDDALNESAEIEWVNKIWVRRMMRVFAGMSLISVACNTSQTFDRYPWLEWVTMGVDVVVTLAFTAEAVAKIHIRGLWRRRNSGGTSAFAGTLPFGYIVGSPGTGGPGGLTVGGLGGLGATPSPAPPSAGGGGERMAGGGPSTSSLNSVPYLMDKWCQFDAVMVFFHWISVALQICEISGLVDRYSHWSILRAPRPLIIVRMIRILLKFSMPKARINQIFKRSSQQIYNVTLFFLFFMSLYGLLGVQFFGVLSRHCVVSGTDPENVTLNDLAIPDTYCSDSSLFGHQCPHGMVCLELRLSKKVSGFSGFDDLAHSFFTVYQAASQEGWSHLMYQAMDSLPAWRAAFYFVTMIFFLAWLVKNVFIAVITETFNEIRVQFQQMWGERMMVTSDTTPKVLRGDERGWRLEEVDESRGSGTAPHIVRDVIHSASFQIAMMLAIVANAIMSSSIVFEHDGRPRTEFYMHIYKYEVAFTTIFNIEVLMKIWCDGLHGYLKRSLHKYELMLAIGNTLHIMPGLYFSEFGFFQVLRIVRLIKASPLLEDFVYKIFGPGKKLGSLIVFTMCLLVVTSAISMQLFCSLRGYEKFSSFPQAFMSMFQILTQEGWTEVMNETMIRVKSTIGPLVAMYFILYHLFVSLIVLSLFVAVILDNLELDEDVKRVKQLRAREQSAGISESLPLRLRVFEHFPNSPQMTALHKMPNDFNLPKVRESFMRSFVEDEEADPTPSGRRSALILDGSGASPTGGGLVAGGAIIYRKAPPVKLLSSPTKTRTTTRLLQKTTVNNIVIDSNNQRLLAGEAQLYLSGSKKGAESGGGGGGGIGRSGPGGKLTRHDARSMRRSVRGSMKGMKGGGGVAGGVAGGYEHLRENGEGEGGGLGAASSRNPHDFDIKTLQRKRHQAEMKRNQREEDLRENHPYFDTPLLLVGRESRFRRLCQALVYARYLPTLRDPVTGKERKLRYKSIHNLIGLVSYLDWIMIVVTTLSCISMMFETPTRRVMNTGALQVMEYVFVCFMGVELLLKTLADGLLFTPKALLASPSGVVDSFVFLVSLCFLLWMPGRVLPNSFTQLVMCLRCFRPLRIYTLVPHMRQVVYELSRGIKEILLVTVLLILLIFVFACYGVHAFGGRLARCNDPNITIREQCVGVFMRKVFVTKMKLQPAENDSYPAILVPRVWANPRRFNFDNIGNAMLALFEVLSFKGWLDIRDVILYRLGPVHSIYIHIFVFLGSMIGLTLFVGVVIANYGENKGTALLTVDQRRWCDLKKRLKIAQPLHLPPRPEVNLFRTIIYDITQHIAFKRMIAIFVLCNSALLCLSWSSAEKHTLPLATISACFTMAFAVECVMKAIAFGLRGYLQSRRNRYDLLVTVLGLLWVATHLTLTNDLSNSFGFAVVILRFFTITGKHATLKMLMLTVVVSVYKSFFIIMGMFLLILFYTLMGVILFGNVKFGENLSRHANFRTAPQGIITLFRIVTGEDWNKIMHDCMISPPYCTLGGNYWETDCGNFSVALLFFCSFYVIITYIVLNLLVAIIMENFSLFYSNEEDALLSYSDIRAFQFTWNMIDVQQRGMIPVRRVKLVLRLLKGRLEVDPEKDRLLFKHMVHEMERLHNGEDVSFHDVLNMLSYRSVDIRKSLQFEELLAREELEYLIEEEVAKQTIRAWLDRCLRRIKAQKQAQSLLQGLRATNEPFFSGMGADLGLSLFGAPPKGGSPVGSGTTTAPATKVAQDSHSDREVSEASLGPHTRPRAGTVSGDVSFEHSETGSTSGGGGLLKKRTSTKESLSGPMAPATASGRSDSVSSTGKIKFMPATTGGQTDSSSSGSGTTPTTQGQMERTPVASTSQAASAVKKEHPHGKRMIAVTTSAGGLPHLTESITELSPTDSTGLADDQLPDLPPREATGAARVSTQHSLSTTHSMDASGGGSGDVISSRRRLSASERYELETVTEQERDTTQEAGKRTATARVSQLASDVHTWWDNFTLGTGGGGMGTGPGGGDRDPFAHHWDDSYH